MLNWLQGTAEKIYHSADKGAHSPLQSRRVFERALPGCLMDLKQTLSFGFNLQFIKNKASAIRERLSQEKWGFTIRDKKDFLGFCTVFDKKVTILLRMPYVF